MSNIHEEHSNSSSSCSINSIPKIKLTFKEPVQPKEDLSTASNKQSLVPPPKSKRQLVPKRAYHRKAIGNSNNNSIGGLSSKNLSVTSVSIGKPGRRRKRNKESFDSNGKSENSSSSFISSNNQHVDGEQQNNNFTDESNGGGSNLEGVNKGSSQEQQSCLKSNFALQRAYKPKWTWRLSEVEVKTALAGSFKSRVWKKIPINHHLN